MTSYREYKKRGNVVRRMTEEEKREEDSYIERVYGMKRNKDLEKQLIEAMNHVHDKSAMGHDERPDIDPSKCCPICGSQCFEPVKKNNGIIGPGGRSWTIYYVCAGCSVMFADPARFLREQEGCHANRT